MIPSPCSANPGDLREMGSGLGAIDGLLDKMMSWFRMTRACHGGVTGGSDANRKCSLLDSRTMKTLNTYLGALRTSLVSIAVLIAVLFSLSPTVAAQDYIPWNKDTKEPLLLNIGPVGVRVKTDHRVPRFPRSESNSGTVEYVFENSPAEGRLQVGDLIAGVNGQSFTNDFSDRIAEAIARGEGSSGQMVLNIERENRKKDITFKIEKIGQYSAKWPSECKKSARILRDACDWLVAHQQPNGRLEKAEHGNVFVLSSVGGLAMLGCDLERYREPLKKLVDFEVGFLKQHVNADGHYENGKLELWSLNYAAIFLAEYYLATHDQSVFPALEFLNQEIYHRQFHQADAEAVAHVRDHRKRKGYKGDPVPKYWFAHGKISTKSSGYIHLGVNVANACVAFSLLHEAGVDVDMENLKATKDYIEKACVSGAMGYAANLGQKGTPGDAFGRTGTLGIALYLDGHRPAYTSKVTGAMNRLYPRHMYLSHATTVMGKAWGVLAIAQLDPTLFRRIMDECQHDFDLLRLSDGSFVANPVGEIGHSKLDLLHGGNGEKHRWTTAFNALIYALGERRLRITGRNPDRPKK